MVVDLNKIKLGVGIMGDVYLYRHGADPGLALDKRPAEADLLKAVVEYVMHDAPEGATVTVEAGEKKYELSVRPVE